LAAVANYYGIDVALTVSLLLVASSPSWSKTPLNTMFVSTTILLNKTFAVLRPPAFIDLVC
jgi:hypothetical protein